MRCDQCGKPHPLPMILTVRDDDGKTVQEARLMLCAPCTQLFVAAIQTPETE